MRDSELRRRGLGQRQRSGSRGGGRPRGCSRDRSRGAPGRRSRHGRASIAALPSSAGKLHLHQLYPCSGDGRGTGREETRENQEEKGVRRKRKRDRGDEMATLLFHFFLQLQLHARHDRERGHGVAGIGWAEARLSIVGCVQNVQQLYRERHAFRHRERIFGVQENIPGEHP